MTPTLSPILTAEGFQPLHHICGLLWTSSNKSLLQQVPKITYPEHPFRLMPAQGKVWLCTFHTSKAQQPCAGELHCSNLVELNRVREQLKQSHGMGIAVGPWAVCCPSHSSRGPGGNGHHWLELLSWRARVELLYMDIGLLLKNLPTLPFQTCVRVLQALSLPIL